MDPFLKTIVLVVGFSIVTAALYFFAERQFKRDRRFASMMYGVLAMISCFFAVVNFIDIFIKLF